MLKSTNINFGPRKLLVFQLLFILFFIANSVSAQPLSNLQINCPTLQYEAQPQNWPRDHFAQGMTRYDANTPSKYLDQVQQPLTAQQSIGCQVTPDGLQSLLWASEDILKGDFKTWAVTWDNKGRAWVAETYDYPNTKLNHGQGNDRIRIIEDTDNDGVADKTTTFVAGLNMPYTLLHVKEGLLVGVNGQIILYKDENKDDKADDAAGTVLYSNFNYGDTHGTFTNFRYGLDNWVYASMGYNGIGATAHPLAGGNGSVDRVGGGWAFRFKSDGSKLEALTSIGCNSAATGLTEDGYFFTSNATCGRHTIHMVYPGRSSSVTDHGNDLETITGDFNVWEGSESFTATSGHDFYTARYLPSAYWDKVGFINEGPYHLTHIDRFEAEGHTFRAKADVNDTKKSNLMASTDAWTAPLQARTGPDGAVWIIDWYNYIFLHNPANPRGAGGAHVTAIRDNTMSRIYRITRTDATPFDAMLDLESASIGDLVSTLAHSNQVWREAAQVEILRRGSSAELLTLLKNALGSRGLDEIDLDPYAIHAVWTLKGLGEMANSLGSYKSDMNGLLLHPSAGVRLNAIRALPITQESAEMIRDNNLLNDVDPGVRMAAVMALRDMPQITGANMANQYCNYDAHIQALRGGTYDNNYRSIPGKIVRNLDGRINCTGANTGPTLLTGTKYTREDKHPFVPVVKSFRSNRSFKFQLDKNGLLKVTGFEGLNPGELVIYNMIGEEQVRSTFDGIGFSNQIQLTSGVWFYSFQERSGVRYRGKILGY